MELLSLESPPIATTRADLRGNFELHAPAPGMWTVVVRAPSNPAVEFPLSPLLDDTDLPDLTLSGGGDGWRARREILPTKKSGPKSAPPTRGQQVDITVRETDGRPAKDILLLDSSGERAITKTDDLGRASLDEGFGELSLFAPDGRTWKGRVDKPSSGPVIVTLPRPVAVTGVVLDAGRREPIPDAVVWIPVHGWTLTDRTGLYVLPNPPSGSVTIRAGAPGWFPAKAEALLTEDPLQRGPTLALDPSATLYGQVSDPFGKPVAGADLRIAPGSLQGRLTHRQIETALRPQKSGPDGRFRVTGLLTKTPYDLTVEAGGFAPRRLSLGSLEAGAGSRPLLVVLDKGRSARGRVVDDQDRPLAGAAVQLLTRADRKERMQATFGTLERKEGVFSTSTGAEGEFRIEHLPAETFDLIVQRQGFSPALVVDLTVAQEEPEADFGTIRLSPGTTIDGLVMHDEDPLPGATVHLRARYESPQGGGFEMNRASATTDSEGKFRFVDLAAGDLGDLVVQHAGYSPELVRDVTAPTEEPLKVRLQRAGRIEGRVLGEDGAPIAGAQVQVRLEGAPREPLRPGTDLSAVTDEEGRYSIADLVPGSFRVGATASGYQPEARSRISVASGAVVRDLDLTLRRGLVVEGKVLAGDRPVPRVNVAVPGASTLTNGDGHYRLTGLRPGKQRISAWNEDLGRVTRDLELEENLEGVDLVFEGGATVEGTVLGADGSPVAGAAVSLRPLSGPGYRIGFTSPDGAFLLANVVPGTYRVSARKDGYGPVAREPELTLRDETVTGLDLVLLEPATISGKLLGLSPEDLPSLVVVAQRAGITLEGVIGTDGELRISGLGPGDWQVSAVARATGKAAQGQVRLDPGDTQVRLDLRLALQTP